MTPQAIPTQLPSLQTDNRGVSPVIGVILMVAITVILAGVIAVYVLGFGVGEVAPNAQASFDAPSSGDATVTLERTDSNKEFHVIANGYTYGTVQNTGDTVEVYGLSDGDDIQLVYYGEKQSHIIQTYAYGYADGGSTVNFTCDASSGKYIVSKSAGDGDCEFETIQNAVDNASAGDEIQIYDGTYDENTLKVDKQLTIIGESQTGVEITASSPQTCDNLGVPCNVEVTGDDVTINTLTIDNTGLDHGLLSTGANTYAENIHYTAATQLNGYLAGSNPTATQSTTVGATLQTGPGGTITDTTAQNATLSAGGDSTIRNNDVNGGHGIYISNAGSTGALVEGNTLSDTTLGIGINQDDSTVRNNVVENSEYVGVQLQANNTVVEYNTIRDTNENGFSSAGIEIIQNATGQTIQNNSVVNNGINLRFHAEDTEKYDAADTHTVTGNIIYGATEYDIEEVDDSEQTNDDTAILQENYWGHNDGANTNTDCTPDSSRIIGDTDTSNPLCDAPDAGAS